MSAHHCCMPHETSSIWIVQSTVKVNAFRILSVRKYFLSVYVKNVHILEASQLLPLPPGGGREEGKGFKEAKLWLKVVDPMHQCCNPQINLSRTGTFSLKIPFTSLMH